MQVVSRTHPGFEKKINEDRLLVQKISPESTLLVVADGLGGHPGGDIAASLVVESIAQKCIKSVPRDLSSLLIYAGDTISKYGSSHPEIDGMGSTGTLALVEDLRVQWTHIGDGRIYHFHKETLHCITRDQTLSRALYDEGKITWQETRNHKLNHFLEQCLGEDDIVPDSGSFICKPGDTILLNTDGLHDMISDEILEELLATDNSLTVKANILLETILQAGAKDNVTFILCILE